MLYLGLHRVTSIISLAMSYGLCTSSCHTCSKMEQQKGCLYYAAMYGTPDKTSSLASACALMVCWLLHADCFPRHAGSFAAQ